MNNTVIDSKFVIILYFKTFTYLEIKKYEKKFNL